MLEEVRSYSQELLRLSERRQVVLNDMVALAQPLPEHDILRSIPDIAETTVKSNIGELGNIRCFQSTNSCNIADFYEKRKRQSQTTSTKPHTIASIHRLIRTMYYLIIHNKLYDYTLAQSH